MENKKASSKIHPLVAGAAISVMALSLVGVAAMTGLPPNSNSTTVPVTVLVSSAPTPAADKITTLAPTTETKQFAATKKTIPAAAVQTKPKHKPAQKPIQTSAPSYSENAYVPPMQAPICGNCGTIESVHAIQQAAQPNGIKGIAGAVLGGIMGNQIGGGDGKKLATVAGVVGGGFAGNAMKLKNAPAPPHRL